MSRFATHSDFPTMIFDDFFANGKAQAGAVRLAMRGEGLEKFVGDFRRDAGTGVFNFSEDFCFVSMKAEENFSAVEQDVGGVADEVKKNATQPACIEPHEYGGRNIFHFDLRGLEFGLGAQVANQFKDKRAVITGLEFGISPFAFGENKDVADHVIDALNLLFDARLRLGADIGIDAGHVEHLGGEADDAQRIFQVMDDGLREASDDRETFCLDHFAQVELVELPEAVADLLQQAEREDGRTFDE